MDCHRPLAVRVDVSALNMCPRGITSVVGDSHRNIDGPCMSLGALVPSAQLRKPRRATASRGGEVVPYCRMSSFAVPGDDL